MKLQFYGIHTAATSKVLKPRMTEYAMLKPRDNSFNVKSATAISTEAQMSLDCFLTTDCLLQTLQTGVLALGVCVLCNEIFKERKNRPEDQNTSNFQTSVRRNRLTRMTSSNQGQRLEHSSNSAGTGWK